MKIKIALCLFVFSATFAAAEVKVTYGFSTHKNKRPYQEDRFTHATIDFSKGWGEFFSICDGHGGNTVSSYLQNNLHKHLQNKTDLASSLCYAFAQAEKYALENCDDGSTAVAAFINKDNRLCYAWVGDSRAVLEKNGVVGFATQDHKPDREDEKVRIQQAGGDIFFHGVWRVNGLAVSRSIGDRTMKIGKEGQIIATPECVEMQLTVDSHFMIMASDGLWDTITNEEAVAMVNNGLQKNKSLNDIAQELQNEAIKRGSEDNIAVCVVKFDW
jgi:protein phosphatase 1L